MTVTLRDHASEVIRSPVIVGPAETLRDVSRTLWRESVGAAIVGSIDEAVGIISERDVVAELAQGAEADTVTAEQAMTGAIVAARPGDRLLDVIFLMLAEGVRHVPVVDEVGTVTGMVSVRDLLRPLLVEALGE